MRHHGVPEPVLADTEEFWDFIRDESSRTPPTSCWRDGETSARAAATCASSPGPGHSTTDALFVDDRERVAFVGDHLLAKISSNTEIYPALEPDRLTPPRARRVPGEPAADGSDAARRLHTGHGDDITDHVALVARRLADHDRRCERIVAALGAGETTAYGIAADLWPEKTILEQPLLVVWEVLGHLDLLLDAGRVREQVTEDVARLRAQRAPRPVPGAPAPRAREPVPRTGSPRRWPPCPSQLTPSPHRAGSDLFDLSDRVAVAQIEEVAAR